MCGDFWDSRRQGKQTGARQRRSLRPQRSQVHRKPLLASGYVQCSIGRYAFDAGGANPLFLQAAARAGVRYLASDSSQRAQNVEQFITQYEDGSPADRVMLPRWPTNIFYNVTNPAQLEDEYNYIYNGRFVKTGQDPCRRREAFCARRNYAEISCA